MKTKRTAIIVLSIILSAVLLLGGCSMLKNVGKEIIENKIYDYIMGDNKTVLLQLNDEWVLDEEYSLDVFETGDLKMEWVQKIGEKPEHVILQLHGGAYTLSFEKTGSTYKRTAEQYAKISGCGVLTPDYRVAPENPYPAALEDAIAAYNWLLDEGYESDSIIIVGDSAGGGLTLALTLYLRDNELPMPAAVITMSPWTDLNYRILDISYTKGSNAKDPYISPVYGDYDGFPPMLMQVGGDEFLLDDTLNVAKKAEKAKVSVTQTTYDGMLHVFQLLFPELEDANDAWDEIEEFIKEIFTEKAE